MKNGKIGVTTENIFPVIKKFLYSDHEIFLRELISNSVDATQKLKALASMGDVKGDLGDLTIRVSADKDAKTLTVTDRGIGMTADEVERYINQIAFSSAEEFMEKYKNQAIIGHFGLGFYCTESEELAKEWAVSSLRNGFVNRYSLDTEYLKILNLNNPDYTILNWIAVLVAHRLFSIKSPAAQRAKRYLIDNFGVNVNAYDLIIGYRADDSYFDFAASFLNNGISVQQLANAMRLGKLGEQIVIKSKYAFSLLHYDGFSIAEKEKYYVLRKARNDEADQHYVSILEEETDGLYMLDILRGGIQNDDPRIPRNLSE